MGHPLAPPTHLADWRSTGVDSGGLSVVTAGIQQTPVSLVVSLDIWVLSVHSTVLAVE